MSQGSGEKEILDLAAELLAAGNWMSLEQARNVCAKANCQEIASDGSTRRFFRVMAKATSPSGYIICTSDDKSPKALAEANATWEIGCHLKKKGIAVPEIYAFEQQRGVIIFEDLGNVRLYDLVVAKGVEHNKVTHSYRQTLDMLVAMQVKGAQGFDTAWCWDTPCYDGQVMVERESGYFYNACWIELLGQNKLPAVDDEFIEISRITLEAPLQYFLHRDFQSRNIMIKEGIPRAIDFQGGRLGPLGYDLASLLIDPYTCLPVSMQEELLKYYLESLGSVVQVPKDKFIFWFEYLSLQRNLQIIGAFSFLYNNRGKAFFEPFIVPSLKMLVTRLEKKEFRQFKALRELASNAYTLSRSRFTTP